MINSIYIVLLTIFFTNISYSKCFKVNQKVLLKSTHECILDTNNSNICIDSELIKSQTLSDKTYKVFCFNNEKIASGYPELNKFGKELNKIEDYFIKLTNKYIILKNSNGLIFYNMEKDKFISMLSLKGIKKFYPLSDSEILIEKFYKKTNSIDIGLFNIETNILKIIATPYDDYVKNVYYNNSFVLDQIRTFSIEQINKQEMGNNPKVNIKFITLPYSNQGSYILDKYLNIISYKETNATTFNNIEFKEIKNSLVHGQKSIYILIFSIFSIIIVIWILKKISISFRLPIITTFYMLSYLVFVYIGAIFLNVFYFEYEFNTHLYERKDLLLNIWYFATVGLYLIPLGVYMAKKIIERKHFLDINKFFQADISINFNENRLYFLIVLMFILSIITFYFYYRAVGYIPVVGIFEHVAPEELAKLRSESGNNFSGHVYRYVTLYKDIPLFLMLMTFILKDKGKKWLLLFIALFVYNSFIAVMDLQKAPLVKMLLLLLLTYFFIHKSIEWKRLIALSLFSFILLIIMYIGFMGVSKNGILDTLQAPFHRAFIGSVSPVFWWQLYIEQNGFLHGATLPNPHHLFGFEYIDIAKVVMDFAHKELRDLGIVGSMPVVFFMEWYANFGWVAAIISMFLFGIMLYSIDYLFISQMLQNKRAILLAMYLYVMFYFMSYSTTSISGILFDTHLIVPLIVGIFLWRLTEKREN